MASSSDVPFYRDEGRGEPLVLLHSGGMAGAEWDEHAGALAERFRVLVPDLPGHGRTPLDGELTVERMADAVAAMLDDAGVDSAHVLGSSMGGAVALWTVLNRPSLVDRLVLFRIGYTREGKSVARDLSLDDPDYWRSVGMADALSRMHEPQGGPDAWMAIVDRDARLFEEDPERHDHDREDLEGIGTPTLVVAGDRDPLVPVEEAVEMYRAIADADLWILPRASHVVAAHTWRSEAFREEVSRFLAGTRRVP
jgi:pimeloyl-ACP methyl ester carboxylesterase